MIKILLATLALASSALALDTPPPDLTATPKSGRWQGRLGLYYNSCGTAWAKPADVNLLLRIEAGALQIDGSGASYYKAAAVNVSGHKWKGTYYLATESRPGAVDLVTRTSWVGSTTGRVYGARYNWIWDFDPQRRQQFARILVDVYSNGKYYCTAKYQGRIKRTGRR